jgi:hypothetical protein
VLKPLQPIALILPTRDLVDDYKTFDSHFFFYRGGVKGVIRDAFAMANGLTPNGPESSILSSVISEYDQHEMACIDASIRPKEFHDFETIELVVDLIQGEVHEFLNTFFVGQQYEIIRPVDYIDRDLMVVARTF